MSCAPLPAAWAALLRHLLGVSLAPPNLAIDQPVSRCCRSIASTTRPNRLGSFADLTCDSDGKLAASSMRPGATLLELHDLAARMSLTGSACFLGRATRGDGKPAHLVRQHQCSPIRLVPMAATGVEHVVRQHPMPRCSSDGTRTRPTCLSVLRLASEAAIDRGDLPIRDAAAADGPPGSKPRAQTTYLRLTGADAMWGDEFAAERSCASASSCC